MTADHSEGREAGHCEDRSGQLRVRRGSDGSRSAPCRIHDVDRMERGACRRGAERVTVAQRFRRNVRLTRNGVDYILCRDEGDAHPRPWTWPRQLHRAVADIQPDIVHLNGLIFPVQTWLLRQVLPRRSALRHSGPRQRRAFRGWKLTEWTSSAAETAAAGPAPGRWLHVFSRRTGSRVARGATHRSGTAACIA